MDTPPTDSPHLHDPRATKEMLINYFVNKIRVGPKVISIASRFYDDNAEMSHEDYTEER